jgi:O-antigen ligase
MDNVFLLTALLYALGFWAVSWKHPSVALALVFGSAPFQNDLSGGGGVKFSFAEINLVLALPLFVVMLVMGERKAKIWPLFWPCVLFSFACVASSLAQWRATSAPSSYVQMFLFFFVVVPVFSTLARRADDLKPALWTLLSVSTFLSLASLVLNSRAGVLGINKNGIGGSLSCALIVALELWFHYRNQPTRHKTVLIGMMGIIALGLLMSLSRGGWIAAASGIVLVTAMRRQFVLLGRVALLMVPLVAVGWNFLPQESREYATSFSSERGNIKQRLINRDKTLEFWRNNYVFGSGMGLRKEVDATNFVLVALAETGVFGLLTFLGLFVAFYIMIARAQKNRMRSDFGYSLLAIGGALMLSRLMQGMVDHYWARGPTMMAWASAGMATGVLWFAPESAFSTRVQRARALLALHLVETRRRARKGLAPPALSRAELRAAMQALTLVQRERAQSPRRPRSERDPLRELAESVHDN